MRCTERAHVNAHIEHIPRTWAFHGRCMGVVCAFDEPCMCSIWALYGRCMGVVWALYGRARQRKIGTFPIVLFYWVRDIFSAACSTQNICTSIHVPILAFSIVLNVIKMIKAFSQLFINYWLFLLISKQNETSYTCFALFMFALKSITWSINSI